ncbi:hypothetical protein INT47_004028 [Mucor saturninus]|uniref:Uncharacterized protein n=1 Tax=Mucor saturninus TaxID=64648 RepID=A0A8H7R8V7_9FUNG|nr:hypothetical protein INT47_004028 [Mucor saturninus]
MLPVKICISVFNGILNLILNAIDVLPWVAYKLFTVWYGLNAFAINAILMIIRTVYNAPLNIYNAVRTFSLKATVDDIMKPLPGTSSMFPEGSYFYRVGKVITKTWRKIECFSLPSNINCLLGISSIPSNCYLYKVSPTAIRDTAGVASETFLYFLSKVVIPTAGFIYPITYEEPKLTTIAYIIDFVIETLFPSKKMMICSLQPQPLTRYQKMMDLLRRAAQIQGSIVNYKLNATVQCVHSRTGERNYMTALYNFLIFVILLNSLLIIISFLRNRNNEAQNTQQENLGTDNGDAGDNAGAGDNGDAGNNGDAGDTESPGSLTPDSQDNNGSGTEDDYVDATEEPILENTQTGRAQAGQTQATQGRATQGQAGPSQAGPSKVTRGQATRRQATQGQSTQNQAGPSQAGPSQATRGQATQKKATRGQATRGQATRNQATQGQAAQDQT